jgi:hypothetical protein
MRRSARICRSSRSRDERTARQNLRMDDLGPPAHISSFCEGRRSRSHFARRPSRHGLVTFRQRQAGPMREVIMPARPGQTGKPRGRPKYLASWTVLAASGVTAQPMNSCLPMTNRPQSPTPPGLGTARQLPSPGGWPPTAAALTCEKPRFANVRTYIRGPSRHDRCPRSRGTSDSRP